MYQKQKKNDFHGAIEKKKVNKCCHIFFIFVFNVHIYPNYDNKETCNAWKAWLRSKMKTKKQKKNSNRNGRITIGALEELKNMIHNRHTASNTNRFNVLFSRQFLVAFVLFFPIWIYRYTVLHEVQTLTKNNNNSK